MHHAVTGERTDLTLDRIAGTGYQALKLELADAVNAFLAPLRARRRELKVEDLEQDFVRNSLIVEAAGQRIASFLSGVI